LRYALGRVGKYEWDDNGCLGFPFGSLFASKQGKRCHDYLFRQLQFRGSPGDPPAGTPVSMFPECKNISSEYDEKPTCETE
jgi:hypothetical protein